MHSRTFISSDFVIQHVKENLSRAYLEETAASSSFFVIFWENKESLIQKYVFLLIYFTQTICFQPTVEL